MKIKSGRFKTALFAAAILLMSISFSYAQSDDEYSFKVFNNTDAAIVKLLVSEDGKKYGYFDIGKGIAAGASATLVWDKSTNSEKCVQFFKAVFSDKSESEPVRFDFCEEDLELEFNE